MGAFSGFRIGSAAAGPWRVYGGGGGAREGPGRDGCFFGVFGCGRPPQARRQNSAFSGQGSRGPGGSLGIWVGGLGF